MKATHLAAGIAALIFIPVTAALAADASMSIDVGQPGFYGHIDIGGAPPPRVVYPQPVVIVPQPQAVPVQPVYLRVRPGHRKNWRRYCRQYGACDRPVYFVDDGWYRDVYVPHYREHRVEYRGHGAEHRRWRDEDRHEDRRLHRGREHDRD